MKKFSFSILIICVISLFTASVVSGQDYYKLNAQKGFIKVKGTSSIHDWEMEVNDITLVSTISEGENNTVSIGKTKFTAPVTGLSSGKKLMDNKAQEALKKEQYNQIVFQIDKVQSLHLAGDKNSITGELTLAGRSKTITFPIDLKSQNSETIKVQSQIPLKMTDFSIDPPTAMMGALKTANDIVVEFELELQKSSEVLTDNF